MIEEWVTSSHFPVSTVSFSGSGSCCCYSGMFGIFGLCDHCHHSQTLEDLLTIHSSVEGVLESFHFGLFLKNASVNVCRQVFPWTYSFISLGCKTESGNVWGNFLMCGVSTYRAVSLYQVQCHQTHTELCHSCNFLRHVMLGY